MTFTPDLQTWPLHLTLTHAYLWFVPFVVDGLDTGHMIQTCCWSRLVPSGICVRATNTCHLLPYLICSIDPQTPPHHQLHFSRHFSSPPSLGRPSVLSFPFQSILTENLTFPKYLKINSTFLEQKKIIRETFYFPQNKNVKKKKKIIWKCGFCNNGGGSCCCTAAYHQRAMKMFWLHFSRALVWSSVSLNLSCHGNSNCFRLSPASF